MKKFLSLLLALTLVVSLCPLSVSAANDVITKVNIKKTDIKADYVSNVGGFGSLSMDGDIVLATPPQDALIDKTGKFIVNYRDSFNGFYYDPASGIISFTRDTAYSSWGMDALFYGEEAAAKSYPVYYNRDGSVAFSLPPKGNTTYQAGPMCSGLAVVVEAIGSIGNLRYSAYVVNKSGEKVLDFPDVATEPDADGYSEWKKTIGNFSDGLALYCENGQDEHGWWVNKKIGFIDATGKLVLDLTDRGYDTLQYFFDGRAMVSRQGWHGYIDKSGKEVISLDSVGGLGSFRNGLACVSLPTTAADGSTKYKPTYIDKNGKPVLQSDYYLDYEEIGDGLYTVAGEDSKSGLININGELVVPLEYDYMSAYECGAAYAVKDGCVYIITADEGASETPTAPGFSDVPAKAYYAEPVKWAVEKGIAKGTAATTFSPEKTCSTAEILTFLWRACGSPKVEAGGSFSDVASNAFYADAASWARSKGMVSGDKLSPETPCTRASAVMFIWQAMGKPAASKAAAFTDVPAGADHADAVAWAVEKGVTKGTSYTAFSPDDICTRGHIVTFLHRAMAE